MSIVKVIVSNGICYAPIMDGKGFKYGDEDYTHKTWYEMVEYIRTSGYHWFEGARFVTDRPFNKEDWL